MSTTIEYQRNIRQNGEEYVTAFSPELEAPLVATDQHPNYAAILEALKAGAPAVEVADLFDIAKAVARTFDQLTERVAVSSGRVYFDGDELHEAITDHIVRALDGGNEETAFALAAFLENLAANPSQRSREQLYEWLATSQFTIDGTGDIIAYKGVNADLTSRNSGKAVVDGEEHEDGPVPNELGSCIEFPRSEVVDDAAVGCATGLHVGTWDYASGFGSTVLKVAVNPRDVVSVPTDCSAQKVRCCRYVVLDIVDGPVEDAIELSEVEPDVPEALYGVFVRAVGGRLFRSAACAGEYPSVEEAEADIELEGSIVAVREGGYEVHELDEDGRPIIEERWGVFFSGGRSSDLPDEYPTWEDARDAVEERCSRNDWHSGSASAFYRIEKLTD